MGEHGWLHFYKASRARKMPHLLAMNPSPKSIHTHVGGSLVLLGGWHLELFVQPQGWKKD